MNIFITYVIESAISVALFYVFYELFLKRDTWFKFNRYFLLFGLVFSLVLPFLDFSVTEVVVNSQNQFEFNEYLKIGATVKSYEMQTVDSIVRPNYIFVFYSLIAGIFFIKLIYELIKIFKTIKAYEIVKLKKYTLVILNNNNSPFSFFNFIFINKSDYGSIGSDELLLHEMTHAQQKHSFDVILLELLLVLQWFNPFIYRYRSAFKEVHEYLADQGVLGVKQNKFAYQKLILSQIEKSFHVNLASQFNYSLTKKRIKMMTRINSGKFAKCKIVFALPLVVILLMAFTVNVTMEQVFENIPLNIEAKTQVTKNNTPSIFPVEKVEGVRITSGFGMRMHPIKKEKMMHNAVDIKAPKGTPVYATADGLVRKVQVSPKEGVGYGKYIIIDHEGGYSTLYSQLSAYNTKEGAEVKQGDIIAYVGSSGLSTGPHLHYEVKLNGEYVDPANYF